MKFNKLYNLIFESPDNFIDEDRELDLDWMDGDITFNLENNIGLIWTKGAVTHNELAMAGYLYRVGPDQFKHDIIDTFNPDGDGFEEFEDDDNMYTFSKIEEVARSLNIIGDEEKLLPKWLPSREDFDILGRVWIEHKSLSTWQGNSYDIKNNIKFISKMLSDNGENLQKYFFECGESDIMDYNELIGNKKIYNNLKAKAHTMIISKKWKDAIRNLE